MKTRMYAVLVGAVVGIISGSTIASVNDKMAEMFGAQSNMTRPGTAEGALRGVVTGGRVMIRTPIVTPNGFSFEPPDLGAGCGGIDMYGGNLSFPSKEQYIATARAVVGNVGGYAFKQALKINCEGCESVMSAIQETVNFMNADNMNSCQIAEGVVEGVKDGTLGRTISERARKVGAKWEEVAGEAPDWFAAMRPGKGKNSPAKSAAEDPEMSKVMGGNWTWDSMAQTEAFSWLGEDHKTREEIMSLLGTVISCVPGVNGCPGEPGTDPKPKVYAPRLRLQDFVAPTEQASQKYRVYTCKDELCLTVITEGERPLGTTVTAKIIGALLGSGGQPGILDRMKQSGKEAGKLTPQDLALVAQSENIVDKAVMCLNAGQEGEGLARTIVEGLAPQLAADMLFGAVNQSIPRIKEDLNQRGDAVGAAAGLEMIEKSHEEIRKQYKEIQDLHARNDMLLEAVRRCSRSPIASVAGMQF